MRSRSTPTRPRGRSLSRSYHDRRSGPGGMLTDLLAALFRGAHYASVVSAFGCFAFLLAVARPAWRTGGDAEAASQLERFLLRLAAWSVGLAVASGLLWLWVAAAGISGQPLAASLSGELIGTVLTATGFGRL